MGVGGGGGWTEGFIRRGFQPTLAAKAPAGEVNTMGSCSGRCTLLALCALQLVSPGVLRGSPDPHQPRVAPGMTAWTWLWLLQLIFQGCRAYKGICHGAGSWLCPAVCSGVASLLAGDRC